MRLAENIVLRENGKLKKGAEEVANIFNDFFVNAVPKLGIRTQHEFLNTIDDWQNPLENAISKYENHPSFILIKEHMEGANSSFVFETVTKEKTEKLVTNLNIRKAVQSNDIPTKLIKEFCYLFPKYIAASINSCIAEGTFANTFNNNEVRPVNTKHGRIKKSIYRPLNYFLNSWKLHIGANIFLFWQNIF